MMNEDYIFEGIRLEGKLKEPKYDNEINSVNGVVKLINNKDIEKLQTLDVCKEMMDLIAKDCVEEINCKRLMFLGVYNTYKLYVDSKNIIVQRAMEDIGAKVFPYDPDASLISSYIFCKTISEGREWKINCIPNKAYEYKIQNCKDNESYFRGDTMNSWSETLNKFIGLYWGEYFYNLKKNRNGIWIYEQNGEDFCKSWEEFFKYSNYNRPLPKYIMDFMDVVYTIGNFALVPGPGAPVDFNRGRACKFSDYWDLTLLEIYEYYMGGCEDNWICSLEKEAVVIKNWLWFNESEKPKGQKGWNKFVETNYMQPFVKKLKGNGFGRPYELWDGHFTGKQLPEEEWQFEQFFVNARIRIIERSKLIAQALVKEK